MSRFQCEGDDRGFRGVVMSLQSACHSNRRCRYITLHYNTLHYITLHSLAVSARRLRHLVLASRHVVVTRSLALVYTRICEHVNQGAGVLWCCGAVVLLCCSAVVQWCWVAVVLWCCGAGVLWCWCAVVLWCCGAGLLLCCSALVLWCCGDRWRVVTCYGWWHGTGGVARVVTGDEWTAVGAW